MNTKIICIGIIIILAAGLWVADNYFTPEYFYNKGQELQHNGEYSEAINNYELSLCKHPKAIYAIKQSYYEWGQELHQNKQYGDAIKKYEEATHTCCLCGHNYESNYTSKAKERISECIYEWGKVCTYGTTACNESYLLTCKGDGSGWNSRYCSEGCFYGSSGGRCIISTTSSGSRRAPCPKPGYRCYYV